MTALESLAVHEPPVQPEQEWANAVTHGLATLVWCGLGVWLVFEAGKVSVGLSIACVAYVIGAVGTFLCSTLSHVFFHRPWLDRFRAWDQAMIYWMIIGTYTPITFVYAPEGYRDVLLWAMWIPAMCGFLSKAVFQYRIHSISTVSYLLLGWLPAIPLYGQVPRELGLMMLAGGVAYSVGVIFLINDRRVRYFHALWHLMVLTASLVHLIGIAWYVVGK